MNHDRWPWTVLLAALLVSGCGREPVATDGAGSSLGADASDEAVEDPSEGVAPEPALTGTVEIAGDRRFPTDFFVCVFPTDAPPANLYRLPDEPGVLWIPIAEDGSFRLAELEPGNHSVVVSDGRFPLTDVTDVVIPSEGARDCRLVLDTSFGHDIHVTDPTGRPAPDVEVTVLRTVGSFVFLGRTDSEGSFTIDEALIGDYLCNLKPRGAHLPKPKGMLGVRRGPRDASYYQLRESDYR